MTTRSTRPAFRLVPRATLLFAAVAVLGGCATVPTISPGPPPSAPTVASSDGGGDDVDMDTEAPVEDATPTATPPAVTDEAPTGDATDNPDKVEGDPDAWRDLSAVWSLSSEGEIVETWDELSDTESVQVINMRVEGEVTVDGKPVPFPDGTQVHYELVVQDPAWAEEVPAIVLGEGKASSVDGYFTLPSAAVTEDLSTAVPAYTKLVLPDGWEVEPEGGGPTLAEICENSDKECTVMGGE